MIVSRVLGVDGDVIVNSGASGEAYESKSEEMRTDTEVGGYSEGYELAYG
jgi:hypothetical protein